MLQKVLVELQQLVFELHGVAILAGRDGGGIDCQLRLYIGDTPDERLTLITCWPYGINDHRLIVIARPDSEMICGIGRPSFRQTEPRV